MCCTLWALNQYENQCISVKDFCISCHGNRCPYLHTDHFVIDEKLSRVDALWSCLVQHATWACLYIYCRSQFGNSITNSIWTQQEHVHCCLRCDWYCLWPVTANEKQTKFQQWNCPHLCAILHYPWHFNSLLNYFQIRTDSWFIQCGTLQRNWSNNRYLKTENIQGELHTLCGLSELYKLFNIVIVVWLNKSLPASVNRFQVLQETSHL